MYNPLELAEKARSLVCKDGKRKYYRFRPSRFYGGISTADCVGCCLRCVFCWSWDVVVRPNERGNFSAPDDVVSNLIRNARKKRYTQLRISGNEPTLCREHLLRVLELIPEEYLFILETNGILIGNDRTYAEELSRFTNLSVRVSLKGTSESEFSWLTGAVPDGFLLQLRALEHLLQSGVRVHPACMISFSSGEKIRALRRRLREIHPSLEEFEEEELILYPAVDQRLKKRTIHYRTGYRPDRIPAHQI